MSLSSKISNHLARKRRVRAKISGTPERPRLTVFRSLNQIAAQIIDDTTGTTLVSASTKELKAKPNLEGAKKLGEALAKKAKDAKVTTVVFDRNGYKYHGRIETFANSAREAGLTI